jgi:RHS repeat-associated protein
VSPAVQIQEEYYVGNQRVAYYANSALHFQHQDWIGTERMRTTFNGAVEGTFTSMPFGDAFATVSGSDGDPYHYAMLDHDYSSDTDHAQFRQYSSTPGRWMSPDPYSGSYHMRNPQSFNRYTYALNNPVSYVDPKGLYFDVGGCDDYDDDGNCYSDSGGDGDYSSDPNAPTFSVVTNNLDSTNTLNVTAFLFTTPIDTTETPGTGYLSDDDDPDDNSFPDTFSFAFAPSNPTPPMPGAPQDIVSCSRRMAGPTSQGACLYTCSGAGITGGASPSVARIQQACPPARAGCPVALDMTVPQGPWIVVGAPQIVPNSCVYGKVN